MKNKPTIFAFARTIVAYTVVYLFFGLLYLLCVKAIPAVNNDIVKFALGYAAAKMGTVVDYYFGTSKDKSDNEQAETAQLPANGNQ